MSQRRVKVGNRLQALLPASRVLLEAYAGKRSTLIGGGLSPYNEPTTAWYSRATLNGGTVSNSQADAMNALLGTLDSGGQLAKLSYLLMPGCGTNLNGCLTPAICAVGYTIAGNIGTSAFAYTDASSGGLLADGNKWLDLGFNDTHFTSNNFGLSVWVITQGSGARNMIGNANTFIGRLASVNWRYRCQRPGNTNAGTLADNIVLTTTRTGPNSFQLYEGGTSVSSSTGTVAAGNNSVVLFASSTAGVSSFNGRLGCAALWSTAPSASDLTAFASAIATFKTALSW